MGEPEQGRKVAILDPCASPGVETFEQAELADSAERRTRPQSLIPRSRSSVSAPIAPMSETLRQDSKSSLRRVAAVDETLANPRARAPRDRQFSQRWEGSDAVECFESGRHLQSDRLKRRLDAQRSEVVLVVVEEHQALQVLGGVQRLADFIPGASQFLKPRQPAEIDGRSRRGLEREFLKRLAEAAQRCQVRHGSIEHEQTLDRPAVEEGEVGLAIAARIVEPDAVDVRLSTAASASGSSAR